MVSLLFLDLKDFFNLKDLYINCNFNCIITHRLYYNFKLYFHNINEHLMQSFHFYLIDLLNNLDFHLENA